MIRPTSHLLDGVGPSSTKGPFMDNPTAAGAILLLGPERPTAERREGRMRFGDLGDLGALVVDAVLEVDGGLADEDLPVDDDEADEDFVNDALVDDGDFDGE